jgi:hypothetical protein
VPDSGRPAPPEGVERAERLAWLPPRAAKARKLILRGNLGLPWLLGAVAAALVILVAGAALLLQGDRPGPPWALVGPLGRFPAGVVSQADVGARVLVVDRRGDVVRGFMAAPGPCQVTADGAGFARPCQGERWDADGRPAPGAGQPALARVAVRVARGGLYVDGGGR